MSIKKKQKVVLLTGASGGIGTITAELLLSKGYIVYGTSRSLDNATKTAYNQLQLDVNDEVSVKDCVKQLISKEKRIDILINNAGYALCGALKDISIEQLKENFETNFFGVHRMIQEIVPFMIKQNSGQIINVGSFAGRLGIPFQGPYSASKAALALYTDALKNELLRDNIKVSLIEPGDTRTDMNSIRKFAKDYENDLDAQRAVQIMHKSEQKGTDPKRVAKKILRATKSKRPKPRYITGIDAILFNFLMRLLPYTIHSLAVRLYYRVPNRRKNKE